MPLFGSRGIVTIVGVALPTVVALAFVVTGYVEWSSDTALAEFMSAAKVSASDPDQSNAKGKTGCPVGKKELPTKLGPLP
jgi:hypothetical protein